MFKTAPDINGDELVYYALEDTVIQAGQAEGSVLVEAEAAGARYNVSEDQIRVSMLYMEGVSQVTNRQGWIYSEGQMKRAKPAYAAGPCPAGRNCPPIPHRPS